MNNFEREDRLAKAAIDSENYILLKNICGEYKMAMRRGGVVDKFICDLQTYHFKEVTKNKVSQIMEVNLLEHGLHHQKASIFKTILKSNNYQLMKTFKKLYGIVDFSEMTDIKFSLTNLREENPETIKIFKLLITDQSNYCSDIKIWNQFIDELATLNDVKRELAKRIMVDLIQK